MRSRVLIFVLFAVIAGAFPFVVESQNQQKEELSDNEALELLRAVNTAEVDVKLMAKQPYAPLEQLLQHRFFVGKELGSNITKVDSNTGTKKGYEISVCVLGEGKRYIAAVVPVERGCRVAFFTDESGVIYQGRALGCGPPRG
jgi:hypothetical protein